MKTRLLQSFLNIKKFSIGNKKKKKEKPTQREDDFKVPKCHSKK